MTSSPSDVLPWSPLLLLLALFACSPPTADSEAPQRPNVLFILVDDLGWKDLGCYGSEFYETPNLDAFAQQALKFNQAYASSPVCSPTRAAILTGQYPSRVNITDWIPGQNPEGTPLVGPEDADHLALEVYTLAEAFRDQGYATFFAGKWHLGDEGYFPEDQGFDTNLGGHHRGSPPGGYYAPYQNPKLSDGPEGEYLTDRLTQESMAFIEQHQEEPFLLFLSYYTVHTPIQASRRHLAKFKAKRAALGADSLLRQAPEGDGITTLNQVDPAYASMVHAMDENVGRLLRKLAETGLDARTLVVFTSDNGGLSTLAANRRNAPTSVRPLRAGKGWCYEGGIRVPLMIRVPWLEPSRPFSEEPVISHDLYPSLLDLAGLPFPAHQAVDGLSLKPLWRGDTLARNALYWHYPHYHGSSWTPGAALRVGRWKLVQRYETGKTELYDLETDIGETQDVSKEQPKLKARLLKQLQQLQRETHARLPRPRAEAEE